MIALNNIVN